MKKALLFMTLLFTLFLGACNPTTTVTFDINFDSNGGSVVDAVTTDGETITMPDNPTKDGYNFDGWYWDNETFLEPFTANSLGDAPLSSDMTVYAKWEEHIKVVPPEIQEMMAIYEMALESTDFQGTYEEWLESVQGPQGEPGEDGREISLQVAEGYIQWQYTGDTTWNNLIDLLSLTGSDGTNGVDGKDVLFQVDGGYIQWQYTGDTTWTNLIDLVTLTGTSGQDGEDGRDVTFQVADGYIQWQYVGDTTWTNLVETASLVDVSSLENDITALDQRIAELEAQLDTLEGFVDQINIQTLVSSLLNDVMDTVVLVNTTLDGEGISSGSGVIYKTSGNDYYVITNNHVVEDGNGYSVVLTDNSEITATLLGTDALLDIAVLKFTSTTVWPIAPIGDSSTVEQGDFVIAIGSPKGITNYNSVTFGITSGIDRIISGDWTTSRYYGELYIQHDAAINPGNSGGPLFNLAGEVIGINTLKYVGEEIDTMGYSIPSNAVLSAISYLELEELYPRVQIDFNTLISFSNMVSNPSEYSEYTIPTGITNGVYVDTPSTLGYFGTVGVQDGDIITKVDGIPVDTWYEFYYQIFYNHTPEENYDLTIYRSNVLITLTYDHTLYTDGLYTYGYLDYPGSAYYYGDMIDNLPYGYGEMYYTNGDYYYGEFVAGVREGYGHTEFASGDEYYGNYSQDVQSGVGIYYYTSGEIFAGIWTDSLNASKGYYFYTNETYIKGYIDNGTFVDPSWFSIVYVYEDVTLNPGDTLEYDFNVTVDNTLIVAFTQNDVDTIGYLQDSEGTTIAMDDDGYLDFNFLIAEVLDIGTYTLQVTGFDENETGPIKVRVLY